jgi:C1A family cysteine protease
MMLYCDEVIMMTKDRQNLRKLKMKASRKVRTGEKLFQKGKERPQLEKVKPLLEKFKVNYRRDPEDKRDYKFETLKPELLEAKLSLPDSVDHTNEMSPVKNQGQLGSCVAFAVSAMKECQERKEHLEEIAKGKRGRPKIYDYSEAWIYWNAKKIDPWGIEDEGTSIRYAMQVLQKIGVPTEKGWPYKDVNSVDAVGEPEKWANLVARWALIDSYYRIDTLNGLKLALIDGPVPIGIPCFYEIFFVGSDGIVPYPANPDEIYGGHAICTVGFDNSKQLIKFKNSWGTGWGDKGYGYLSYKYVSDFLWDAWAAKDLAVTQDMLKGTRELV